jgi:hypothetical protein
MQQKQPNFKEEWPKIIAKAWSDPNFKKKLLTNPQEVLKSYGYDIPSDKRIVVYECTENTLYLTLPEQTSGELTEDKLQKVAAGFCVNGVCGH